MFNVYEHGIAAFALGFGDKRKTQSCLAGGFRAVNFNNSSARKAADAEGEVYCDRTRANRFDIHFCRVAQPHQRAFAELLIDHAEGGFKRFVVLCDLLCGNFLFCHGLYYRRIYFLIRVFLYSGGVRVSTKLFFAEIFISPRGDLPNMLDGKMRR